MVSRLFGLFKRRTVEDDCEEIRGLSSDYIDEDLEPVVRERVKSHLDWCPPCNAFVNTLRTTVGILRATPKRNGPGDLRQRIRENIRKDGRQ